MESSRENSTEAIRVAFYHRAIVSSIMIGVSLTGLLGNSLVIVSVIITKKLRTITNILVVNLALADILTCCAIPLQISGLLSQTGRYPTHGLVCTTVAGIEYISIIVSISNLVAIAFVRWYVITRSIRSHQGINTAERIIAIVVIIWILAIAVVVLPHVLGIVKLGYSEYYSLCVVIATTTAGVYYILYQGIFAAVSMILTLTLYALILRHVLKHNKNFRDMAMQDSVSDSRSGPRINSSSSRTLDVRPPMIKAINQKEIEITKNVFTVVCIFIICFAGSSVNFIIPGSSIYTLYSYVILLANSVVNPIVYGLKHPNFQEAFKKILCCRRMPLEYVSK